MIIFLRKTLLQSNIKVFQIKMVGYTIIQMKKHVTFLYRGLQMQAYIILEVITVKA